MKKCLMILPYFGKFPDYFPLFLRSCGANQDFQWLLLTDNRNGYEYPPNVLVHYISFAKLKEEIQQKFDFPIMLDQPYKLCDYRPAYGYLFEDVLEGYDWWGHCDCDLVFGSLSKLLFPLMEEDYDKLFAVGHLSLYRNSPKNNRMFMRSVEGSAYHKRALQTRENCWFDEDYWTEKFRAESIQRIFKASGAKLYTEDLSFNISLHHSQFRRTIYVGGDERFRTLPLCRGLYYYENGHVKRIILRNGKLQTEEYLYMHFQNRKMHWSSKAFYSPMIQIYPNGFRPLERLPRDVKEWKRMTRYSFNAQWFRIKWGNLKRRWAAWRN